VNSLPGLLIEREQSNNGVGNVYFSGSFDDMYTRLKAIYTEVKNHNDFTHRSIPYFVKTVQEIRVELQKVSNEQAEQITQEVSDAMRQIAISEREDLNNIESYMKEIPKYLGRMRDSILRNLEFVDKPSKKRK
jgi:hypothetical protein